MKKMGLCGRAMAACCLILLPLMLLPLGCAHGSKKVAPKVPSTAPSERAGSLTSEEIERLTQKSDTVDPFLRTQVDVGLQAAVSQDGTVLVTLENKTRKPLTVGPKFFGVIVPGSKEPLLTQPRSRTTFPVVTIQPGEQASGELSFPSGASLRRARLVFNHPEARPAMAQIK